MVSVMEAGRENKNTFSNPDSNITKQNNFGARSLLKKTVH